MNDIWAQKNNTAFDLMEKGENQPRTLICLYIEFYKSCLDFHNSI